MKLTLITATFNSESNITTCLDSIVNQDYDNLEHLIIDGKSSDNTLGIVKSYQEKYPCIKYISEKDQGIYDALNKGIKLAKGDVIGFIHSDDFLFADNIISNIISLMTTKKLDGVYGDLQYVDKHDTTKVLRNWKSSEFNRTSLKKGWMPPHPTLFLKKEVYDKHGLFDLTYKISADYDYILRIFSDSQLKFGYMPKVITRMKIGGTSNRSLRNIITKSREDYKAIKNNKVGNLLTLTRKNTSKFKQFL